MEIWVCLFVPNTVQSLLITSGSDHKGRTCSELHLSPHPGPQRTRGACSFWNLPGSPWPPCPFCLTALAHLLHLGTLAQPSCFSSQASTFGVLPLWPSSPSEVSPVLSTPTCKHPNSAPRLVITSVVKSATWVQDPLPTLLAEWPRASWLTSLGLDFCKWES